MAARWCIKAAPAPLTLVLVDDEESHLRLCELHDDVTVAADDHASAVFFQPGYHRPTH
jgi:hypothetical protein